MRRIKEATILDQAIERLKKGESLSAVLSSYPADARSEISELVAIANLAVATPKTRIPEPTRRKLFLDYQPEKSWLISFTHIARFTYPAVIASLVLALTGTVSAAMSSLPGDTLFPVKRAVEETQLKMATDPQQKAMLQLQLANQRLEDAQKVLAQNDNPQAKTQAINELTQQTTVALNNVKAIATDPTANSGDILSKVEKLAKDQGKLVAAADPGIAQKDITNVQNTVSDIKKLFATTNDQSSAQIPALDKIEVTGAVTAIKEKSISIDSNKFDFDPKNVTIQDNNGNSIDITAISMNDTVKIDGHLNGKSNLADSITLLLEAPVPTPTPSPTPTSTPTPTDKPVISPTSTPSPTPTPPPAKPKDTFTGFIPEGPAN